MPNRTQAPPIASIHHLELPPYQVHRLSNGIPLYVIHLGDQEVCKLELVFHAGRPYEHKPLAARATLSQLKEGTLRYSAADIAETLDFYGATLQTPYSLDTSNVALYTLNKYFHKALPVLAEILGHPTFPQHELDNFIQRNQVELQVELSKTDVVAYRKITELIFGEHHPYGYNSYPETYAALTRDDLLQHFHQHYLAGNCSIFLSGHIQPDMLHALDDYLSEAIKPGQSSPYIPPVEERPPQRLRFSHPDKVQAAIRIGRRLFNRAHPDYAGMYVLNTVLGGYFGSRLMTNIREEKGYTYNIYSSLEPLRFDGAFLIATEIGTEFVKDTLAQIYQEVETLCEHPVDDEELAMVRNYLMGGMLNMLDGPFNVADIVKTAVVEDLPMSYFQQMVGTIQRISASELLRLAQQYLAPETLWEVCVGAAE